MLYFWSSREIESMLALKKRKLYASRQDKIGDTVVDPTECSSLPRNTNIPGREGIVEERLSGYDFDRGTLMRVDDGVHIDTSVR